MAQQTKYPEKIEEANGVKDITQEFVGIGEDHSMSFDFKDVVDFAVEGASISSPEKPQNGTCFSPEPRSNTNFLIQAPPQASAPTPIFLETRQCVKGSLNGGRHLKIPT